MRLETILRAQAVRHPDKIALICGGERLAYRDLDRGIQRVANGLRQHGVGPGDRIVVFLSNGIEIVELFYAAFSVGAIVIPVTTRLTPHELQHICSDSQPLAIVFDGEGTSISEVLQENPDAVRITTGKKLTGAVEYAELRKAEPDPLPPLSIEQDDAIIMYSSGTTGKPKGAIITHANIVVQHYFMNAVEWGISSEDRYLVTTPLAHRTGFARLANSLTLGGTLVVMNKFDPRETVETIAKERITVVGMVPTVCRMLLAEIRTDPSRCGSLRRIVVTGEAFPVELKRQFLALLPDVRLVSFFAMTEVGGVTSLSHEEQFDHASSIGRPTPGVEIRIVDDAGVEVKLGEPGELLVRVGQPGRYSVMRGYYNRPEETAKAVKDGWIHTGDVAKADEDGYLYIVDRKKDMVLSGGFNIYTKEVEQALLRNPEIADAAVVGVPDAVFGEAVAAFIEREQGSAPTPASVVEHVRNLVAGYKKPKYVFIVDTLPRNSLGKVLKRELRDQATDLVENAQQPPKTSG
jgi:acyl-CoA synthetase (AMP-forming)/AMP-acid ligase II